MLLLWDNCFERKRESVRQWRMREHFNRRAGTRSRAHTAWSPTEIRMNPADWREKKTQQCLQAGQHQATGTRSWFRVLGLPLIFANLHSKVQSHHTDMLLAALSDNYSTGTRICISYIRPQPVRGRGSEKEKSFPLTATHLQMTPRFRLRRALFATQRSQLLHTLLWYGAFLGWTPKLSLVWIP